MALQLITCIVVFVGKFVPKRGGRCWDNMRENKIAWVTSKDPVGFAPLFGRFFGMHNGSQCKHALVILCAHCNPLQTNCNNCLQQ